MSICSLVGTSRTRNARTAAGKVYLVGAGPGDPGLLTRKGASVLSRADVVVYDHLASSRLLDLAPPAAVRILRRQVGRSLHLDPGRNQRAVD